MATDSIRLIDDDYMKRIHSNRGSGKLHKGHSITAASASIPSKYQTIVIDNSERKGFNSRSKRFNHLEHGVNDNPGPGRYLGHQGYVKREAPSFSKKGTGGFASKDARIAKHESTCSPGSGAYGLPTFIQQKRDYNKAGNTSNFHTPIAQPSEKPKNFTPAPNQYNALQARINAGKINNVGAEAAFKSKSRREFFNLGDASKQPAPWQYHIKENLVKDSVKVPCSSFKSKTERKMQHDPESVPGPGTYKPHEDIDPVKKTIFPKKHYLCISAPAMPLPETPAAPGPGAYEVVNYEGPDKHFMSSSVFVSTTSRWTGGARDPTQPGPAHYRPMEGNKQSFIYNAVGRWI